MLWRLLKQGLTPYRPWLWVIVVLQFTGTMASLFLPSLNADIIDNGVAKGDTAYIWHTGADHARRLAGADRLQHRSPSTAARAPRWRSAATCAATCSTASGRSRPRR